MSAWDDNNAKFNALSERERIIIAVLIIGGLLALAFYGIEILMKRNTDAKSSIATKSTAVKTLKEQVAVLDNKLKEDPNETANKRKDTLILKLDELDKEANELLVDLVSAEEMSELLTDILSRIGGLTLSNLTSIPSTEIVFDRNGDESNDYRLYTHGLSMTFTGEYFNVLKFIQEVESLSKKLFWKKLEYKVSKYPKGSVQVTIYTISGSKEFINVKKIEQKN